MTENEIVCKFYADPGDKLGYDPETDVVTYPQLDTEGDIVWCGLKLEGARLLVKLNKCRWHRSMPLAEERNHRYLEEQLP